MAHVSESTPPDIEALLQEQSEATKLVLNRIVSSNDFQDIDYRVLASIFYEACHSNPCAQHILGNLCERCDELALAESWFELAAAHDYHPSRERLLEFHPRAA